MGHVTLGTFLAQHELLPWIAAAVCLGLLLAHQRRRRGIHHRRFLEIELRLEAAQTRAAGDLADTRVLGTAPKEEAAKALDKPGFLAIYRGEIQ
jgi:hypothetical protein